MSDAFEFDSGRQQGSPCVSIAERQWRKVKINVKGVGQECPIHTPTLVVLLRGYRRDLGEPKLCDYIQPMTLVLMMVGLAFGLLYVAVVAEERQMQEATKPRKR